MSNRARALEFIRFFAAGDLQSLEPLLATDLRVDGPYLHTKSKAAYLDALQDDPPEPARARIVSVTDDADAVAVFYEYQKKEGTIPIAQLFRFGDGRITEIRLVFDTAAE